MISKDLIAFNGQEKVKYRKDRKSDKVKYDESKVAKVIFKNSDTEIAYFEYVQLSEKTKGLFKVITKGKATLYARKVGMTSGGGFMHGPGPAGPAFNTPYGGMWAYSFNDYDEFYVLRENESIASPLVTARISRSFKKRAIEYFADCPDLVAKLEEGIYIKDNVREVVQFYNKCQ